MHDEEDKETNDSNANERIIPVLTPSNAIHFVSLSQTASTPTVREVLNAVLDLEDVREEFSLSEYEGKWGMQRVQSGNEGHLLEGESDAFGDGRSSSYIIHQTYIYNNVTSFRTSRFF